MSLRLLLTLVVVLIIHGSLYPWQFHAPPSVMAAIQDMFKWQLFTGMGDTIGNVLLFVPLGFLSTALARNRTSAVVYGAFGAALAALLQILQTLIPSRDAEISDVIWNVIGILIGSSIYSIASTGIRLHGNNSKGVSVGCAICVLRLALECWPLVPTFDLQHVKDAAKPLLLYPTWSWLSATETAISVFALSFAITVLRGSIALFVWSILLAVVSKFVFIGSTLSMSHAAGLLIGLISATFFHRLGMRPFAGLTMLLSLTWVGLDELRPFTFLAVPTDFQLVPFQTLLEGSLEANLLALVRNLFWTGALILPAITLGIPPLRAAGCLSALLLLLEIAQRWVPGRSPDITLTLLPVMWALLAATQPGEGNQESTA